MATRKQCIHHRSMAKKSLKPLTLGIHDDTIITSLYDSRRCPIVRNQGDRMHKVFEIHAPAKHVWHGPFVVMIIVSCQANGLAFLFLTTKILQLQAE